MNDCMTFGGNAHATQMASPNGSFCFFIKLHDTGLKVYREKWIRDQSYNNQIYLHYHGLAPRVYFKTDLNFADNTGGTYYAFETELADVLDPRRNPSRDNYNGYFGDAHCIVTRASWREYRSRFVTGGDDVQSRIEQHNNTGGEEITWDDDADDNVGFINGVAVMIDCADHIFEDGRLPMPG